MIFISHSSKDKPAAIELQRRLLAHGYDESQLYLDSDAAMGNPVGSKWEQVLYARLKGCRALIALCSANWQESKWCFAELVFAKATGKEIFPVLLHECSLDLVVAEHQAVFVYKEGEAAYARLLDALPRDDFPWPPDDGEQCPFPGLPAFDERLAGVYFGREAETKTILQDLRNMRSNGEPRLLMIVGGSGSGKSSLLKAGVLPRLKNKIVDTEWVILPTLRYGEWVNDQRTIFDQLAANVTGLFPKGAKNMPDWKLLRTQLKSVDVRQASKVFTETMQDLTLTRNRPDATVLIAIDQFEELLSPSAGPMAAKFLRLLNELLNCRNGQLLAIGTMRSDHLDIYEQSSEALRVPFFQSWRLGPFPPERIEDIVRKPAHLAHIEITDELVERLKLDTPTIEALPLLAFTLEKLYRRFAIHGKFEVQDYVDLGGMEGSIQACINHIIPSLSTIDATALRLAFVRHLAQANDKGEVVRRTARWGDLPAAARPILEKFVSERLLTKSDIKGKDESEQRWVSVEVAHEAMFQCWSDLRAWLDASADILRWRRDLGRDRESDLKWTGLRPAQLAVARDWLKSRQDELTPDEVYWINKGILFERIRRGIVASAVLVVVLLAGMAWWQRNEALNRKQDAEVSKAETEKQRQEAVAAKIDSESRRRDAEAAKAEAKRQEEIAKENAAKEKIARNVAEEEARISSARRLAAESAAALNRFPQRSLLLAVEAIKLGKSFLGRRVAEPEESLREALSFAGGRPVAVSKFSKGAVAPRDHSDRFYVMIPGKQLVITGNEDRTAEVWDPTADAPEAGLIESAAYKREANAMAISTDHHWLVTGCEDGTARLWDLSAKDPLGNPFVLRGFADSYAVRAVAISPDNHWAATAGYLCPTHLWDLSAKDPTASPIMLFDDSNVRVMAISPDSHWLVTGSGDEIARLWDLRVIDKLQPQLQKTTNLSQEDLRAMKALFPIKLRGHEKIVYAVAFTPDGHWLVTCSDDSTSRLWDLSAKNLSSSSIVLRGHERAVHAAAVSLDNRWLVTGGNDRTARLWDLTASDPSANAVVLRGHEGAIRAVAISADDRWLVTGSDDCTARLWDLSAKNPSTSSIVLRGHEQPVASVRFSPDSSLLVTGSNDRTARIWNLTAPDLAATPLVLRGHEDIAYVVGISPDSRWLVTGSADHTARLWDMRAKDQAISPIVLRGHEDSINAIAISRDGRWLVTGSNDCTARLWDLSAKDPAANMFVLRGHQYPVRAVVFSPDNHWLVTGGDDSMARLWDLSAKDPAANALVLRGHEYPIRAVAVSPDSHWLATGSNDSTARLWDLSAKDPSDISLMLKGHEYSVHSVAISSDSRWLATGSSDHTVRLWDLMGKDPSANPIVLQGHKSAVGAVAITPDNRWLVTGSDDCTARLWNLGAENPTINPIVLRGHAVIINTLAISPDSHWLVTGSADKTARLWDLRAKDPTASPFVLRGHEGWVFAASTSPDGHLVATGSDDGTARLWDITASDPSANSVVLRGHERAVRAVEFSPNDRWLATGSLDGTARLWPLETVDLIDLARKTVGRNFTTEEWNLYFAGEPYHKTFPDLPGPGEDGIKKSD